MTISPNNHPPTPREPIKQFDICLYVFEADSDRECGTVCTLTSAGLICELSAHPAAGIQHYPVEQPIASVLADLLAARHDAKES